MYYIIFILCTQISILFNQDIDSIEIKGNKKTKDYIILREIKQEINQKLKPENIIEDKNRIYNLGLFLDVDIRLEEDPEVGNVYKVTVSENWYLWPAPIINYDYDRDEFSYGAAISHTNFRGRDENLSIGATIGHVNEYFIWYDNPWISGNHNSFSMGIYNESSTHHVYNIIEKDSGILGRIGFFKGNNKKFKFSLNYNKKFIKSIQNSNQETLDLDYLKQSKFEYISFHVEYRYDTRDVYIDPHSGILWNIKSNNLFGINGSKNIYSIKSYFNLYHNLYKSYIDPIFRYKLSVYYQYSSIDLPIYQKKNIGGQGYVRGYEPIPNNNSMVNSRDLIEVDNYVINTFEIQSTIIKRKEYFPKLEMGLDILFFADYGLGYNLNHSMNFKNSLLGYGIGFKIFFMGGVLKLDYALNYHGNSKLHLF